MEKPLSPAENTQKTLCRHEAADCSADAAQVAAQTQTESRDGDRQPAFARTAAEEAAAPAPRHEPVRLPEGAKEQVALPEGRPCAGIRLCIITGLSGSGKSTAMQVFEDLLYFTVDGLPARMAPEMVNLMSRPSMAHFKGIALGLDIRQSSFLNEITDVLDELRKQGCTPQLIFLEAETEEIMRRYATTRRPHPLEREGVGLENAVLMEKKRLARLRSQADMVINTSKFSIHDLRRVIQKRFRDGQNNARSLRVFVTSFGFKHAVPREADYIFDLRFLPNPYFVSELREKNGLDQDVADYVFATPKAREFLNKLEDLIFFILPLMESEGRYRLTLAFGCTGGHHRSVAVAEAVGRAISQAGYPTTIEHPCINLG